MFILNPASSVNAEFVLLERCDFACGESVSVVFKARPNNKVSFSANGWLPDEVTADKLGIARYSIDTNLLKPGEYAIHARENGADEAEVLRIHIGPKRSHERMAVHRWGHVATEAQMDWLLEKGFTGGTFPAMSELSHVQGAKAERTKTLLDYAARKGFSVGLYLHPLASRILYQNPESRVLRPDGQRVSEKTPWPADPLTEVCRSFAKDLTNAAMKEFGSYPAFDYALLCSEHRPYPSVNPDTLKVGMEDLGFDISPYIVPLGFQKPSPDLLNKGIVPDDDPLYHTMKWFWEKGHGTQVLNRDMDAIIKAQRPDIATSHEPWRLAPVRDTAKGLDLIGTWTYAQTDLKRLFFLPYLRSPGRKEGQKVQALMTLYVYGYMVMPIEKSTAKVSDDQAGNDPGFNADPDYTREALWIYFAQRPEEFSIYWAGAFSPDNPKLDRFVTSPESFDVIGDFSRNVIEPYSPAILKTAPAKAKVAVHLSALSTWFTDRKVGWNKCEETLPYSTLLLMNHVPFDVLLDDDILEGALKNYECVVLPHAETFTEAMYEKLKAFQFGGGTVIANEPVAANDIAGAKLTRFDFSPLERMDGRLAGKGETYTTADEARNLMEKYARKLSPLVSRWKGEITADGQRVITNTLAGGEIHYHFAINDERTYGPRFGEHKLYFESGVRQRADLTLSRPKGSVFYDVLSRKPIEGEWKDGKFHCKLWLAAADGRIIASLPEPLAAPEVTVREGALERGKAATIAVKLNYVSGKPVQGVVPLLVNVKDGEGQTTHHRRYTATADGKLELEIIPAVNDAAGQWSITVEELIGGATGKHETDCK